MCAASAPDGSGFVAPHAHPRRRRRRRDRPALVRPRPRSRPCCPRRARPRIHLCGTLTPTRPPGRSIRRAPFPLLPATLHRAEEARRGVRRRVGSSHRGRRRLGGPRGGIRRGRPTPPPACPPGSRTGAPARTARIRWVAALQRGGRRGFAQGAARRGRRGEGKAPGLAFAFSGLSRARDAFTEKYAPRPAEGSGAARAIDTGYGRCFHSRGCCRRVREGRRVGPVGREPAKSAADSAEPLNAWRSSPAGKGASSRTILASGPGA